MKRRSTSSWLVFTTIALTVSARPSFADGIHRGPATREPGFVAKPVLVTPADRVRIETVPDPARVPEPLRGKFVGSVVGLNHENLTVVLADGKPAIVHRDLIQRFDVGTQHGSGWKHILIGAGIGAAVGALSGLTSDPGPWLSQGDVAVMGVILFTPIGAAIGALLPCGETWKQVPLERVEWSPEFEHED